MRDVKRSSQETKNGPRLLMKHLFTEQLLHARHRSWSSNAVPILVRDKALESAVTSLVKCWGESESQEAE